MAKFRFRGNPNVVLEFHEVVDILSTRQHPEYEEIKEDGTVVGAPKSDVRPEWDIPMKGPVGAPVAPKGKKAK